MSVDTGDINRIHQRIDGVMAEAKETRTLLDNDIKGLRAQFTQHVMDGVNAAKKQLEETHKMQLEFQTGMMSLESQIDSFNNKIDPLITMHEEERKERQDFRKMVIRILMGAAITGALILLGNGLIHTGEGIYGVETQNGSSVDAKATASQGQ